MRHAIRVWLDPAGVVQQDHQATPTTTAEGTRITMPFPMRQAERLQARQWARAYALLNPHAVIEFHAAVASIQLAESDDADDEEFYQADEDEDETHTPTVAFPAPKGWRKFLPTDFTAPHWYTQDDLTKLIFLHINQDRATGTQRTLRNFVRGTFRGLTGSAKAKKVCDQVSHAVRLVQDFEAHEALIPSFHAALCEHGEDPSPKVLGRIGHDHIEACFAAWYGVKRSWYAKAEGKAQGIPFCFEIGLAETVQDGEIVYGLNFSRSFHDPLRGVWLDAGGICTSGIGSYLATAHVFEAPHTAAIAHLVCPRLPFLDYGKSTIATLPEEMTDAIAEALWSVAKTLYKEGEQRRKDADRAARNERNRDREQARAVRAGQWTIKDAVAEVIEAAYEAGTASGVYPLSVRDLYYEVRPRLQQVTDKELDWDYFSQGIVPTYRRERDPDPFPLLYYKPRGILYEPHTGTEVQLGTREVDAYTFPAWLYDKILYIEKSGMMEALRVDRLAERYDMAIVCAEGYASEAARTLFQNADADRQYKLFVLHDADPYGYNIARTLREATRRMPDYSVDVIDMGLRLGDALEMGLEKEWFTRQKALPSGLELNAVEREYFEGRPIGNKRSWECQRVELNAIPVPARVAYIEAQLQRHGATEKVVPPTALCRRTAQQEYLAQVERLIDQEIERILDLPTLITQVRRVFRRLIRSDQAGITRTRTRARLEQRRTHRWQDELLGQISYSPRARNVVINTLLAAHLKERLALLGEDEDEDACGEGLVA